MDQIIAKNEEWVDLNSSVLLEVTRPTGVFTCTAVAISPTVLLTAAHCLDGTVTKITVSTFPERLQMEVAKFALHPEYRPKKSDYLNDIAQITLKKALPKSIHIHGIYNSNKILGKLIRLGFGERNSLNNRTVITPSFKFYDEEKKIIELNDHFSKSGDSGGPIFLSNDEGIFLLAIHSTFSSGPQGEYSFNPLVGKYTDWIELAKTKKK